MMGAAFLLAILLLRVLQNFCAKRSSQLYPETRHGQAQYLACLFGVSSLLGGIALCLDGMPMHMDGRMLGIAAISGTTLVLAQVCMLLAMQSGTMVIVTAFSTAGLIVPCVAGALFLGEGMSVLQSAKGRCCCSFSRCLATGAPCSARSCSHAFALLAA